MSLSPSLTWSLVVVWFARLAGRDALGQKGQLVVLACSLAVTGCNAVLDIEKAKVRRSGGHEPSCAQDAALCPPSCADGEACPEGQTCVEGSCTWIDDAGLDSSLEDATLDDGALDGDTDAASDADASDAGCTENELRCEGAALPTRLRCVGGMWKSAPACETGQLCDTQSTPTGECKPVIDVCLGQKPEQGFCVGAERVLCGPDLVTATRKDCVESALCNLGTDGECAACNRNDASCEGDNLLLCKTDYSGFAFSETCKAGECRANLGRCSAMLCDPDAWSCAGKILEHCNATGSGYIEADRKDCGTGICDEFSGKCKVCEPNANLGCADATHQSLCDAEGANIIKRPCTELSSATPSCVGAGVCVMCAPGSKTCQDPRTAIACSGQGNATPSTCTGTTCVAGQGCAGECAPDTYKCTGAANPGRMKCGPEGVFNQSEMCEPGSLCDGATGQCKPIVEGCAGKAVGEVVCVGSKRVTCGADMVNATSQDCASPELCAVGTGSKCATCTDATWECREAELWKCNTSHDAMVRDQTCASAALCNANLKTCTDKVCEPNKKYCDGATLRTCDGTGSAVLASTPCPSGICDNTAGECDQCNANEYLRCSGTNRVRCNPTGQGEVQEPCQAPTPACTGKGQCVQCMPNTDTCSSDLKVATHCDANGSRTTENCAANQTCFDGDCGGVCGPGQYQCGAAGTSARNACGPRGTFSVAANCGAGEACEASTGQCKTVHPACTSPSSSGQWVCSGRQRVQCSADRLTVSLGNTCETVELCGASSGNVCALCLPNQRRCLQAKTQSCSAGQWVDGPACTSAMWCDQNTGTCLPPNCTPGAWRCTADRKNHEQCDPDGNRWNQVGTCGWCDTANPSACYQCQPNVTLGPTCASGTQQSICNAQGTSFSGVRACGPSPRTICAGANACVECTSSICDGNTRARTCTNGSYQDQLCSATQVCLTSPTPHCGGDCRPPAFRCNPTTKNPDTCLTTGVWQQTATCNRPSEICSASATESRCVTNQSYTIGPSTVDDTWGNLFTLENTVYFRPITASRLATLQFFRLWGHPPVGDTSGLCRMAIYTDMGGWPRTLLTWTPTNIPVIDGVGGAAPGSSSIQLNGTYWLATECWHPSGSATLRAKTVTGERYIRASHTFGTDFPTTWTTGMGTEVLNTSLAFFVLVQNVP